MTRPRRTAKQKSPAGLQPNGRAKRNSKASLPTRGNWRQARTRNGELGQVSILPISVLKPSKVNDALYRPVDPADPEIIKLAESIRRHGIKEPLVVTLDFFILSGHRRYAAAKLAGLVAVPVRFEPFGREDVPDDQYAELLREYNQQRVKSLDERLREELVSVDPAEAYQSLIEHRQQAACIATSPMRIVGEKRRAGISSAKRPFLDAIQRVLDERRRFWPLSDRQIHYPLLNDPPLRHASKPDSRYRNDLQSYKSLCELLTRARLTGLIPMEAIADETRPVVVWQVHREAGTFIRGELDGFLKGYWRDLMQSQPNHIEIVGEKNTVAPILKPICSKYCIPLTTGRGYCSLPPRHAMAERFRKSGKEKLVILLLSDFDPDGEEIAQSFARSMRDDFGIDNIHPVRVALTASQVQEFKLPPLMTAKTTSAQYQKFHDRHGENVWELEALPPGDLQTILTAAIDAVIDTDRFNAELDAERADAVYLQGVRQSLYSAMKEMRIEHERMEACE